MKLDGEGLPEQRGERGGGDEVADGADFVRATGVVAILRLVERELHEGGKGQEAVVGLNVLLYQVTQCL
ncbi:MULTISPECIES: hypothetical protein [unclassified Eikenella]|uniref:hypothetical protein n=1 Tax=Eikenella TaxID=538 RepID=UPI000AF90003|nr:hypothetical protein [Eikenella sp. NML97-A-109]